jgi:DNA protecting protein DprA
VNRDLAILRLLDAPGIGPRKLTCLLIRLAEQKRSVLDLFSMSTVDLKNAYEIEPLTAEALHESEDDSIDILAQLEQREIFILSVDDARYPQRLAQSLGSTAPPVLFAWGNLTLLDRETAGFCGSRKASANGQELTAKCAAELASQGINVVSGYAQGVDIAAHHGALASGGVTTIVLALGILNFQTRLELRDLIDPENTLVLSEFPPRLGWHAHNAMIRNRTICGLSDVMIVIEAGAKGGTFEAGKTALKLKKPLFAAGPGSYPQRNS